MCAIARFSYSNSEFFLNFLLKTHTNISCGQITPSHKCDKNQLCKYCNKYCKTYIMIIISLLFSLDLTQKPITKTSKNEKKFFLVTMFITLPLSSSKDNKQTNHTCNFFFNKLNLVRLFRLINVLEK